MKFFVSLLTIILLSATVSTDSNALTGTGLPNGCSGGELRYEASYPFYWEKDGSHLRLIYVLPNYSWCWISHHGRVDTNWASGGADKWTAVLRNDYYTGGYDRLEVMVPSRFWWPYYSAYRALGYDSNTSYTFVANLFWVWAYYH